MSSGLRSGRCSTINSDTNVEDNQNLASVENDVEALAASSGNVGKKIQKRISEYDEKFIPWPVQEVRLLSFIYDCLQMTTSLL